MERLMRATGPVNLVYAAAFALVGLLAVWAVDGFTAGNVATVGAYICVAFGLTLLVGGNGQISLGHAALMAVGAYTMGKFLTARTVTREVDAGPLEASTVESVLVIDVVIGLVLAVVVTTAFGGIVGVAAARLRGPYLAGATLALGVAVHGVVTYFDGFLHGDEGVDVTAPTMPVLLADLGWKHARFSALIAVLCAAIALFLVSNLKRSAVGRHWGAVRDHEVAAQLCGLSVPAEQIRAFAVSSASAGLGGALIALLNQKANPGTFSLVLSLTMLAAVVIGGLGSLRGAIWGSLIVVFLQRFLEDIEVNDHAPAAVFGLLLIVVMLAAPGGIQGVVSRLGGKLPRRSPQLQGGE